MIKSVHNSFISRRHWLLILLTLIFLTGQWIAMAQPVSAAVPVTGAAMEMADCDGCGHEAADYCDSICALGTGCSPQIGGNTVLVLPKAGFVRVDYQTSYQFRYAEPIYHPPIQIHT
ncbi:hypothetical protein [Aliamphritea spongicola]|uniref:hypothetical protein n=1 Tax=Aliamphritea spongicola TaxID=707589 RepID=UPI00196AFFB2|nr:hypothetical protein [Aliamphritea spongicola]MBN3562292.1 hypothetical protein [Aliamphritea spongicola]